MFDFQSLPRLIWEKLFLFKAKEILSPGAKCKPQADPAMET